MIQLDEVDHKCPVKTHRTSHVQSDSFCSSIRGRHVFCGQQSHIQYNFRFSLSWLNISDSLSPPSPLNQVHKHLQVTVATFWTSTRLSESTVLSCLSIKEGVVGAGKFQTTLWHRRFLKGRCCLFYGVQERIALNQFKLCNIESAQCWPIVLFKIDLDYWIIWFFVCLSATNSGI